MFARVVVFAAAAFALSATPSEASCLSALTWQDQVYIQDSQDVARPGVILAEPATTGRCNDTVTIYVGETTPRPKPYRPPREAVISTIVGVPPAVAVLRDGQVYRNLEPLEALPWAPWPRG
jgi:hypothetical protein